jgi:Domain of unknown function (DUF5615)
VKIKLDENLPGRLVAALTDLGHDADTVVHERLAGVGDDAVWQAAQQAGRFLIYTRPRLLGSAEIYTRYTSGSAARAAEVAGQNCLVQSDPVPIRR